MPEQDGTAEHEAFESKPADLYIPSNSRVTRWEEPSKRILRKRRGFQPVHEKTFTPQCFSAFPSHYSQ